MVFEESFGSGPLCFIDRRSHRLHFRVPREPTLRHWLRRLAGAIEKGVVVYATVHETDDSPKGDDRHKGITSF